MLEQSQKLTDGLIIYSVLVSDYEKLDFKNDALAGVRANYFNSGCKEQKEITEIELHGMDYKMSCLLTKNEPLSWKVTRDNLPYQSVKRATGGVYSVITYNDRGIVFKRQFFDRNHTWLRTEYFNRSIADKLITRIYPRKVSGIITLVTEDIDDNGIVSVKTLFPSDKQSNENSRVLIYSNVGMLWYDASFLPSDMPFTEKKSYGNSGFVFNGDLFKNDFVPENAYNLEDCAYLTDEDIPNVSDTAEPVSKKDYSAYDIIEKILVEAHKTNKDLFGEIINHTAEEDFEPAEVKIVTGEKDEQLSDDEVEENSQISEHEIADDTDAVAETADEQTEDSKNVVTIDSSGEASEDEETDFENVEANIGTHFQKDDVPTEESDEENPEIVNEEEPHCDVVILTKSGRYTYFGNLDENNCRTGRGRTVSPDGMTSYDGEYLDDRRNGFGVCYYNNGSINYVGNWTDNSRNGGGVGYRLSDGTMHAGKWDNNTPDGYGARFDRNGNLIDVSNYENGVRTGKSVSFDENGNIVVSVYENGEKISEFLVDAEV
jgi:antitoxin component YwqK of YwqJK toxin-antitoxin module